jgi:membrane protein required for colicin V production
MQAYDIFMLIVLAAAVVWGAWKGLAWQLASLASIALSYFVALNFRQPLAAIINASPPWNVFLAMLILFLGTGLVVWVGFNLVSEIMERVRLKEFDRQLGALFGAAKGVVLCVLITLFSVALLGDAQRQAICNSMSGYYIAVLLDRADAVIPQELHQVLDPYIHQLDETVGQPSRQSAGRQPASQQPWLFGTPQPVQPARGEAAPQRGSFQTREAFMPPSQPAEDPRSAGRIEARPARSSGGSFER